MIKLNHNIDIEIYKGHRSMQATINDTYVEPRSFHKELLLSLLLLLLSYCYYCPNHYHYCCCCCCTLIRRLTKLIFKF